VTGDTYYQVPRDYTDRQLIESIWRRIDGLALMLAGPIKLALSPPPEPDPGHREDLIELIGAWLPPGLPWLSRRATVLSLLDDSVT
jgi:hypothetical protein